MARPKFTMGFKSENPTNLWLGVSLDNSKLQGHNLAVFADLVNRHASKIETLFIVVGCEIYGHYVGKETAKLMGDQWILQAQEYLNEKTLKMPFQFVRWSELTGKKEYEQLFKRIQNDYETDTDFKNVVDQLAEEFKKRKKCKFESARNYLLDECAVYLMFDGKTTYPDKQLNFALQYVITKYKKPEELQYIGYEINNGKLSDNNTSKKSPTKQFVESDTVISALEQQSKTIMDLQQQVLELKNMMLLLIQNQSKTINPFDESSSPNNKAKIGFF